MAGKGPKDPLPRVLEVNVETGEQIERDATPEEAEQMALDAMERAEAERALVERELAKAAARERLVNGKATYEDLELLGL